MRVLCALCPMERIERGCVAGWRRGRVVVMWWAAGWSPGVLS